MSKIGVKYCGGVEAFAAFFYFSEKKFPISE